MRAVCLAAYLIAVVHSYSINPSIIKELEGFEMTFTERYRELARVNLIVGCLVIDPNGAPYFETGYFPKKDTMRDLPIDSFYIHNVIATYPPSLQIGGYKYIIARNAYPEYLLAMSREAEGYLTMIRAPSEYWFVIYTPFDSGFHPIELIREIKDLVSKFK